VNAMFNRIKALIAKETLAVLRDPRNRAALIVPPLLQLMLFAFTATLEVKNINLAVLNDDTGQISSELIQRFEASKNFRNISFVRSPALLRDLIDRQTAVVGVHFQADFSRLFYAGQSPSIEILLDGRKSNASQIVEGYITSIVDQYNSETMTPPQANERKAVSITARNWFNPNLDYIWFTVPSLVVIITLQVSVNVTSMSIAREREMGTFDQLLVSPLGPLEIMAGKTVPAFILALAEATIFVLVAVFIFRIPFRGSIPLLYASLIVFVASVVGIGLAISSVVATQQQALLGIFTFLMPALLMCGYTTPIENMPHWLQPFTYANPLRYMMVIVKGLFLKSLPAADVCANIWPMAVIAVFTLTVATWFFRRRMG
jgi:ABC-2 type transport system permease protein